MLHMDVNKFNPDIVSESEVLDRMDAFYSNHKALITPIITHPTTFTIPQTDITDGITKTYVLTSSVTGISVYLPSGAYDGFRVIIRLTSTKSTTLRPALNTTHTINGGSTLRINNNTTAYTLVFDGISAWYTV